MKKTLITLMALASVAMADAVVTTVTDNAFADRDNWTLGSGRGRDSLTIENGSLRVVNSNWGQTYAEYSLDESITLSHETSLSFSVDITTPSLNSEIVMSLVTSSGTYLLGKTYNDGSTTTDEHVSYGFTADTKVGDKDAVTYAFNTGIDTENCVNVTPKGTVGSSTVFTSGGSLTLSGSVEWNGKGFSMILNDGTNPAMTWDLETDKFSLEKINIFVDGGNNTTNVTMTNLAMSTTTFIPEPATATLSLLALAGLAARRRRK